MCQFMFDRTIFHSVCIFAFQCWADRLYSWYPWAASALLFESFFLICKTLTHTHTHTQTAEVILEECDTSSLFIWSVLICGNINTRIHTITHTLRWDRRVQLQHFISTLIRVIRSYQKTVRPLNILLTDPTVKNERFKVILKRPLIHFSLIWTAWVAHFSRAVLWNCHYVFLKE